MVGASVISVVLTVRCVLCRPVSTGLVIFYNKEIFARHGLTRPATWEEFVRICDMLLANGETPMSLSGQNPFISSLWFDYLNMRMNGPEFHRDLVAGR